MLKAILKRMSCIRSILLLVLVLSGLISVQAEEQWSEVRSPHFNILTNGGEQRGRDVMLQFEQMRSLFAQLFFKDQVAPSIPLQIVGLKNQKQLSGYAPLFQGKPVDIAGFYLRSQDKNYIVLDLETHNRWEAVFHEYAHLILDNNLPDAPAWFSEGFAQLCSTIIMSDKAAVVGRAPEGILEIVRTQKLLPVYVLFNVDHSSPIYNDDHSSRTLFYAQSWLAVRYLWETHRMDAVRQYLKLIRRHIPVNDAVKQAFGVEPAELDRALEAYSRAEIRASRLPLPGPSAHVWFSVAPVTALQAAAALADLHAHQDDYRRQAISEFQQVLEQDPENAIAQRGLGYALFSEHRVEAALPWLQKAAERDAGDWLVHYYLATVMAQRQDDADAPAIEREARIVTRLNPGLADGHGLLGFALMVQHKIAEAATSYATALRLKPESEAYALNLAELYTRQGKVGEARVLFSRLQNSQNFYVSAAARSHLEEQQSISAQH